MALAELQINMELLADSSSVDPALTEKWIWVGAATQFFMMLASLYCMWTIRNPKKE